MYGSFGELAQLVEQAAVNRQVASSSLALPALISFSNVIIMEQDIWYKNKKAFNISHSELLNFLKPYNPCKFHFNGKSIKRKKLLSVVQNNVSIKSTFNVKGNHIDLPFYKGDYKYFKDNYGIKGFNSLRRRRIYITILEK